MPVTMPTLTEFKRFARQIAPAARAVLMARVFADMERERVNAYILPIFQSYHFEYDGDVAAKMGLTGPIPSLDQLYLADLDSPKVKAYYAECDTAHRANGFLGEPGYCPALCAESLVTEAERALLDLAEPLCGIASDSIYGDNRATYLDLLIGAALKTSDA